MTSAFGGHFSVNEPVAPADCRKNVGEPNLLENIESIGGRQSRRVKLAGHMVVPKTPFGAGIKYGRK